MFAPSFSKNMLACILTHGKNPPRILLVSPSPKIQNSLKDSAIYNCPTVNVYTIFF